MSEQPAEGRHPIRVFFLCTHNSSRSQMAEGLLRARGSPTFSYEQLYAAAKAEEQQE